MGKLFVSVALIAVYYVVLNGLGYSISNLSAGVWGFLFIFVPLVGIPLAVLGIAIRVGQKKGLDALHQSLTSEGFSPSHQVQLSDDVLLIDERNKKLCVAVDETISNGKYRYHICPAKSILSCSIVSDGEEVTTASPSSVLGRALVGGLLFGGVGAIVGGVTASRVGKKKVKSLELKILVEDERHSSHRVRFFTSPSPIDVSSIQVRPHLEDIERWQVRIELLMAGEPIPASGSLQALQDHAEAVRLKGARQIGD